MKTKRMNWINREKGRTMMMGKGLICLSMLLIACFITLLPVNDAVSAEKKAATKEIVVVSPPDGSFVTEKTAFLSGHILGEKIDSVTITGVEVKKTKGKVAVTDNTFGALVSFKKGINTLTVAGGGMNKQVKIFYTPGDKLDKGFKPPKGFKRFYIHGKADPLKCTECHRKRRGKIDFKRITPARSNCTTGNCHPKMGKDAAHVHGPVGAGVCISCHNPHGSHEPLQMARTGQELCLVCHEAKRKEFDQEVIHAPVEEGCVDCHDPHQSPKRFQLLGDAKSKRVSSLCFNCHEEEIFTKKHQHGPVGVGDCIACHFPHASANETLLIAPLKEGKLCFECHEGVKDQLAMKNTHKPVLEDCGKCHDPHSSENRFQLNSPPKQLCESCHLELSAEIYKTIKNSKVQHEPVAKGECTGCHSPHGSPVASLLKGKGINLCGTCHEDLGYDIAESKNLHGPVQTGSCNECHNVHGSNFSRLLIREFPEEFYTSYKQEKYDLCFGCHNKDVATKKSTTKLTNFRDGDYNLHNFHVNRIKGRSCIACHDPHASLQPKHVRYEVPFGSWSYPIELTATKTGGGCVVGCHAPKDYDRVKAVGKPSQ